MSVTGVWPLTCPSSAQTSWQDEGEVQLADIIADSIFPWAQRVDRGGLGTVAELHDTMSPEGLSTFKNMFAQVKLQAEEVFCVYLVKFAIENKARKGWWGIKCLFTVLM